MGLVKVRIIKEWKVQYDINGEQHLFLKLVVSMGE